jgi:uncharacterized membrane protein
MNSEMNVAGVERWASAISGAALTVYGLKKRSIVGAVIAASGGALLYRAATGHCAVYAAAGINTADGFDTRTALGGSRGVNVETSEVIDRPVEEVYRFWRNFENLPRFMRHLVSVTESGPRRSHWVATAPAGATVEWDADIINEVPNELIGWRTVGNSEVVSAGSVKFSPSAAGAGTQVKVRLQYEPPAGKLGAAIAWMFGQEPRQTIQEDLGRLKQLLEKGSVA